MGSLGLGRCARHPAGRRDRRHGTRFDEAVEDRVVADVVPRITGADGVEHLRHDVGVGLSQGAVRDNRHGRRIVDTVDRSEEVIVPEAVVVGAEDALVRFERHDLRDPAVRVAGPDSQRLEPRDGGVHGTPGRRPPVRHEGHVREEIEPQKGGREPGRDGRPRHRSEPREGQAAQHGQRGLERHRVAEHGRGAEPRQEMRRDREAERDRDEVAGIPPGRLAPPHSLEPCRHAAEGDEHARQVHAQERDPAQEPGPGRKPDRPSVPEVVAQALEQRDPDDLEAEGPGRQRTAPRREMPERGPLVTHVPHPEGPARREEERDGRVEPGAAEHAGLNGEDEGGGDEQHDSDLARPPAETGCHPEDCPRRSPRRRGAHIDEVRRAGQRQRAERERGALSVRGELGVAQEDGRHGDQEPGEEGERSGARAARDEPQRPGPDDGDDRGDHPEDQRRRAEEPEPERRRVGIADRSAVGLAPVEDLRRAVEDRERHQPGERLVVVRLGEERGEGQAIPEGEEHDGQKRAGRCDPETAVPHAGEGASVRHGAGTGPNVSGGAHLVQRRSSGRSDVAVESPHASVFCLTDQWFRGSP